MSLQRARRLIAAATAAAIAAAVATLIVAASDASARTSDDRDSVFTSRSVPIEMIIGGHPASVVLVEADRSPRQMIDAIAAEWEWTTAISAVRRGRNRNWHTLSRVDEARIETLQLQQRSGGGSTGYLVTWRFGSAGSDIDRGLLRDDWGVATGEDDALADLRLLIPQGAVTLAAQSDESPPPHESRRAALPSEATSGSTLVAWVASELQAVDREISRRAASLGLESLRDGNPVAPHDERARFYRRGTTDIVVSLLHEGEGTAIVVQQMRLHPSAPTIKRPIR